jgi:hypothetical protein
LIFTQAEIEELAHIAGEVGVILDAAALKCV